MNTTITKSHTPAPWKRETKNMVSGPQGCLLAQVKSADESADVASDEQQDANAYMIAAAPELLEALKQCEACLNVLIADKPLFGAKIAGWTTVGNTRAEATAAIAKAEGRTA